MKKLGLLIMPLMAVSLLASCGQSKPQVAEHFVTFESNGGSHINTQRVDDGEVATNPGESTRPGYHFEGWYTTNPNPEPIEEDKYNFDTKVTNDITLYAGWTPIHYNFSFNGTGCTILNDYQYTEDIDLGSNRKFIIVPDSEHTTLLTVQITKGDSCASYENGIITIVNMDSDVEVVATAEERKYFDVSVSGEHIHYYKDNAFEVPLESVKAKKGEDFVFYMLGEEDVTENSEGYVPPTSLTIKIKDKIEDECYKIEAVSGEYENLLKKVTIYSDYIVDDIIIQGDGVKKDYYQMRLPYLIGLKQPEIQGTFFEYGEDATFEFIAENSSTNAELLTVENIFVNLDGKEQEWISPSASNDNKVTFEHTTDNHYYLHIKANAVISGSTNIINVVARAKAVSILNSVGWNDISRASEKGYAPALFDIGDTKNVNLNGSQHRVRIIDFNEDNLASGKGKVGITFDFADTIKNFSTWWNRKDGTSHSTNFNFIKRSNLNDCLQKNGEVYKQIPSDLMDVIKTVTKSVETSNDEGATYQPTSYDTKLFPLSVDEIDGNDDGTYEYYKTDSQNRRVKNVDYWLRSPYTGGFKNTAWEVYPKGIINHAASVYDRSYAVAPAFCI